ncbi:OmpA family protein [Micromonospora sp. NPDC049044]|uniref:OmpA family protein n=1 Tax=Micromonospora sp. NPDC049044 TaxID=3154827 RepID=UPI0033CF5085
MRITSCRGGALVVAALLGVPLLAACTPPVGPQPCGWMEEKSETSGRTAILVDVTNSTRSAGSGRGAPDYQEALRDVIAAAVEARDTVSVAPFSGSAADLSASAVVRSADWKHNDDNPDNQGDRRTEAERCLGAAVGAAQASSPTAVGTDVLRPAASAADWLRQGKGAKHLVVATDGLVTSGCASLVKSDFSGGAEIEAITAACADESVQELRPAVFDGIEVTLVGIGHPAAGQAVPKPAQTQWLKQLWERFCAFQGGTCDVRTSSVGSARDRVGPSPVPEFADPQIGYGSTTVIFDLPEAALFETGKARLLPAALPLLTQLAVTLRTGAVVTAKVRGFADPRGDDRSNKILSEGRAKAVADFLRTEGVPNVEAEGMGETTRCTDGRVVPATATSDQETECARRVEILATRA